MLSCSNSFRATPVPIPKPKPKPTPAAACTALTPAIIDRTHFTLTAKASAVNGATINGYSFTIKDKAGKVVYQSSTSTHATSFKTNTINIETVGTYVASMTTQTSLGTKTAPSCNASLTVVPPQVCIVRPELPANSPECKRCIGDNGIWYKDKQCIPDINHTKSAVNLTQSGDATKFTANPGDRIQYTLTINNTGKDQATQLATDQLGDLLEYSTLQDMENIIFGTILVMVVAYFYARSQQMSKEVRLIRHNVTVGTL